MRRRSAPTNAQSLSRRIDNLCASRQIPVGRARRLVGIVAVGQILRETDAGMVKGASNIELRLGTANTRASSDLDAVRRAALESHRTTLERAFRDGWQGFTGRLRDLGTIQTPGAVAYRPHRFRLKIDYRGGDFASFTLEVSADEAGSFEKRETCTRTRPRTGSPSSDSLNPDPSRYSTWRTRSPRSSTPVPAPTPKPGPTTVRTTSWIYSSPRKAPAVPTSARFDSPRSDCSRHGGYTHGLRPSLPEPGGTSPTAPRPTASTSEPTSALPRSPDRPGTDTR